MLNRQKAILALLEAVGAPVSPTRLVKLMFLARHETGLRSEGTFYDFVPYRYGPFSFALYRELDALRRDGYLARDSEELRLNLELRVEALSNVAGMPPSHTKAVVEVVSRYGRVPQRDLLRDVYRRYPWYATKSELTDLAPGDLLPRAVASPAVHTAGYEGKSVDSFFDGLLRAGIECLVDVRANPASRKYGFARKSMGEIGGKLSIEYRHVPELGIPSTQRVDLSDYQSYQRLFDWYEREVLPGRTEEVQALARLMAARPSVLVCMERKASWCHRGRLAEAVAAANGLEVVHLGGDTHGIAEGAHHRQNLPNPVEEIRRTGLHCGRAGRWQLRQALPDPVS
jgi:uncharacterized protein (DUF488 family)